MSHYMFQVSLTNELQSLCKVDSSSKGKFVICSSLHELVAKAMGVYGLTQVTGPYELTATASSCVIESDEVLDFLFKMGSTCVVLGRATAEQLDAGVAIERNLDDVTNRFVNNSMASSSPDDTLSATVCTQVESASTQGASDASDASDSTQSSSDASASTQDASIPSAATANIEVYYDVPEIVKTMRKGKENNMTAAEIIRRAKTDGLCDPKIANLIKKAAACWLMSHCTEKRRMYPSTSEFLMMAKSIVGHFPSMGNNASTKPWDLLYDKETKVGLLELYCRQKRYREKRKNAPDEEEAPLSKRARQAMPITEKYSSTEVEEAESFMRNNAVTAANTELMLTKLAITRQTRREMVVGPSSEKTRRRSKTTVDASDLMTRYPLFIRLKAAVDEEFTAITNTNFDHFTDNWTRFKPKLINRADKLLTSQDGRYLVLTAQQALSGFRADEENILVLEMLLHLLPNTNPNEMVKGVKTSDCLSLILHKFDDGTPIRRAVSDAAEMIQPGLLLIGKDYYIKIAAIYMKIGQNLPEALAYLVAFFYILGIDYPLPLKFVYLYFEALFPLSRLSISSVVVKRLVSDLSYDK